MLKQVPFRCSQNHVTILVFTSSSTKSLVICEKCIEVLREGRLRLSTNYKHTFGLEEIIARRY